MRHPLMRIEDPEERYPSPKGKDMAKILGYESVEEMQKAFDESIPIRPLCADCGYQIECTRPENGTPEGCSEFKSYFELEAEEEMRWAKEHPLRCETCASYVDGDDSVGLSEGCEGEHWQSMYLPGFPFPNGCKHHSKRQKR